jgi:hypothetical protein
MKNWAPILKEEARIKVSWEKRTICARSPETDKIEQRHRTYRTIEGAALVQARRHVWA